MKVKVIPIVDGGLREELERTGNEQKYGAHGKVFFCGMLRIVGIVGKL